MPGGAPQGYTGQISLGGATFTLGVDEGAFNQALDRAKQTAQAASADIGKSFGQGSSAAMGLLYLGQAVDDLQYGFRAIVNNIPQLTMALGAGAGVAGAMGILGVAIQQVISHWDELTAAISGGESALPSLSKDLQDVVYQLKDINAEIEDLQKKRLAEGGLGMREADRLGALKDIAAEARQMLAIDKAVEAASGFANTAAGRAGTARFVRAAGAMPGGAQTIIDALMYKMSGDDARKLMGEALLGSGAAQRDVLDQIPGNGVFGQFRGIATGADERRKTVEANLEKRTQRDIADAEQAERDRKQEAQDEQRRQLARIEARKHALGRNLRIEQQAADEMSPAQMFGSMRAYLSQVTVSGADQIRKQQLDVLKQIKASMDKLNDKAFKIRNDARFQ